ncbi:bifunctional folylpolyglutamate synthase/dihydrofolate synthase [Candidatus Saganbacteria bacterium]|nr:bifunctional folylpolyglutamate synthase/dihydrofolate synthase [Candidatus Saganbacteria bacterium]
MKYLDSLEKFGMNLGLDRIKLILGSLDNPQFKFSSIHITGTNGKGSTAVMAASILKEAGYKVSLYTSPHLLSFTERIKINGVDISHNEFNRGLKLIKSIAEKLRVQPTVFEVLTATAFWYFAKQKVDYAVVEVGMGGRLDATNVLNPLVSVITNIDFDHREILGKTLARIAAEKAAIIKPGIPVVTAEKKSEPLNVLKRVSRKNQALLAQVEGDDSVFPQHLIGNHQKLNAACAVAAVRLAGIKVTRRNIECGLGEAQWPGRLQVLRRKPLAIVDGAHNPAGAKVLKEALQRFFPGKFTVIYGGQRTKDYRNVIKELQSIIGQLIVTRSSNAQAQEPSVIYNQIKKTNSVQITASLAEALDYWNKKLPLLITGSLFLVAEAMGFFYNDNHVFRI